VGVRTEPHINEHVGSREQQQSGGVCRKCLQALDASTGHPMLQSQWLLGDMPLMAHQITVSTVLRAVVADAGAGGQILMDEHTYSVGVHCALLRPTHRPLCCCCWIGTWLSLPFNHAVLG
jgi:hypothetical protein